jgi:pimeloyl-ACP methyl ester carboxylesterase
LNNPACRIEPIEVEVGPFVGLESPITMRGWIRLPRQPGPRTALVYCLAGGSCSTGYFDLDVAGHDNYSMAEHFATRGAMVIALDHPGVGGSDPIEDLYTVTPTSVAAAHDMALRHILDQLTAGDLVSGWEVLDRPFVVGLGHSMGAMLAGIIQARHDSFDALALLGHGSGLPELLTDDELNVSGDDLLSVEHEITRLARLRFDPQTRHRRGGVPRGTFFADDVPVEVRAAFRNQRVPLLYTCGLTSMIPRVTWAERAAIEVPTLFAFGDQDLTADFIGTIVDYRSLTDLTMLVLSPSGHCHNQSSSRKHLWDRLLTWIDSLRQSAVLRVELRPAASVPTSS